MHSSILYGAAKRGHTLPQQQSTPQLSPPPPRPHLSNSPPLFAAADQWLKRSFLNDKAHAEEDLQEALKEALAEASLMRKALREATTARDSALAAAATLRKLHEGELRRQRVELVSDAKSEQAKFAAAQVQAEQARRMADKELAAARDQIETIRRESQAYAEAQRTWARERRVLEEARRNLEEEGAALSERAAQESREAGERAGALRVALDEARSKLEATEARAHEERKARSAEAASLRVQLATLAQEAERAHAATKAATAAAAEQRQAAELARRAADDHSRQLQARVAEAESHARQAEAGAKEDSARAEAAEARSEAAEEGKRLAEAALRQAEAAQLQAETLVVEGQRHADEAAKQLKQAEAQLVVTEGRVHLAEERAKQAEEVSKQAKKRAAEVEELSQQAERQAEKRVRDAAQRTDQAEAKLKESSEQRRREAEALKASTQQADERRREAEALAHQCSATLAEKDRRFERCDADAADAAEAAEAAAAAAAAKEERARERHAEAEHRAGAAAAALSAAKAELSEVKAELSLLGARRCPQPVPCPEAAACPKAVACHGADGGSISDGRWGHLGPWPRDVLWTVSWILRPNGRSDGTSEAPAVRPGSRRASSRAPEEHPAPELLLYAGGAVLLPSLTLLVLVVLARWWTRWTRRRGHLPSSHLASRSSHVQSDACAQLCTSVNSGACAQLCTGVNSSHLPSGSTAAPPSAPAPATVRISAPAAATRAVVSTAASAVVSAVPRAVVSNASRAELARATGPTPHLPGSQSPIINLPGSPSPIISCEATWQSHQDEEAALQAALERELSQALALQMATASTANEPKMALRMVTEADETEPKMALRMVTEADETEPEWLREASDVLSASPSASAPASVRAATPADDIALAQQVADALAAHGGPRSFWRPVPRAPAASQAAASQAAATASKTAQAVRQLARVCSQLESLHAHSELSTRFHSWHSAARALEALGTARGRTLRLCVAAERQQALSHLFTQWHTVAVGFASAMQQSQLEQLALRQAIEEMGFGAQLGAPGDPLGDPLADPFEQFDLLSPIPDQRTAPLGAHHGALPSEPSHAVGARLSDMASAVASELDAHHDAADPSCAYALIDELEARRSRSAGTPVGPASFHQPSFHNALLYRGQRGGGGGSSMREGEGASHTPPREDEARSSPPYPTPSFHMPPGEGGAIASRDCGEIVSLPRRRRERRASECSDSRSAASSRPSSSRLADQSAELHGSLRLLGSNLMRLAREGTANGLDVRSVVTVPGRLFSATKDLVPRLAEHVSPAKLLNSMVRELNETLTASGSSSSPFEGGSVSTLTRHAASSLAPPSDRRHLLAEISPILAEDAVEHASAQHDAAEPDSDAELHSSTRRDADAALRARPGGSRAGSVAGPRLPTPKLVAPTEEALRQHNELQLSQANAAAAAAAAVLSRLTAHLEVDGDAGDNYGYAQASSYATPGAGRGRR